MPSIYVLRRVPRNWEYRFRRTFCNDPIGQDSGKIVINTPDCTLLERDKGWVRTPNYFTKLRTGQALPDNSFLYEERRVRDTHLYMRDETVATCSSPSSGAVNWRLEEHWVPSGIWNPDTGQQLLSDASLRAKLIEKAKGPEWSVPTFIGEGRESIGMIANAARTIASSYRDLRRGNLAGALGSLGIQGTASQRRRYHREFGVNPKRAAANAWLAYTYGWKPLVNDVYRAAETMAESAERQANRVAEVRASTNRDDHRIIPGFVMGISPAMTARKVWSQKESWRGVWRLEPTQWDAWGSFGLLNPALVAWELLPFSFVVDWFLPVGRYLEGLDVTMRFKHLGGSIGYRRKVHVEFDSFSLQGKPQSGLTHDTDYLYVHRDPLTAAPTVGLDSITFEPKLGAARVTSAIALMSQVFRR